MAYGGAVAMCSGKALLAETDYLGLLFLGCFGAAILTLIMMNNRGKRTVKAIFLTGLGLILIWMTTQKILGTGWHYIGSGLLFLGIWTNGSLYYILKKVKQRAIRHLLKYRKYDTRKI